MHPPRLIGSLPDADALFAEFASKGAQVVYPPTIREGYGMNEFAIRDQGGYVLAFGSDTAAG